MCGKLKMTYIVNMSLSKKGVQINRSWHYIDETVINEISHRRRLHRIKMPAVEDHFYRMAGYADLYYEDGILIKSLP